MFLLTAGMWFLALPTNDVEFTGFALAELDSLVLTAS
jgi:hypothetical protein